MFVIKGFASNNAFAANQPGIIHEFGELSTQARTFSKEIGIYKNNNIANIVFNSFTSKENDVKKEIPLSVSDHIVEVADFVYKRTTLNPTVELTPAQFVQQLTVQYSSTDKDFMVGAIESDGTYYVPQWVQWRSISDDSLFRVWFVDTAFRSQFDDYEIEFIAPFDILDDFFLAGATVEQRLSQITSKDIVDKIQERKGEDPETFIRLEVYDYHDPLNTDRIIPTDWGIIGYGVAATNIDVIKQELIDYILANSTHTQEEWAEIFPDIFKKTEFILVPFWDSYAIEPRTTTPGIYSPFALASRTTSILKEMLPDYSQAHIDQYAMVASFPFKSLLMTTIGSLENRDSKFQLTDFFPDFIDVSSTSEDFNRMTQYTKDWSVMVHELVVYAEDTDPDTLIPLYISKITRDGILYLSRLYDNVQYLVATKYSIDNL